MNIKDIVAAARELAKHISACMRDLRTANPNLDPIYGVCLVVSDDFSSLTLYANTASHFGQSDGGMRSKWYFGEWWSEGMEIDTGLLVSLLGEVGDFDETPEKDNGPSWLAAMTIAMEVARRANAFHIGDDQPFLLCSIQGSSNAVWLENVSAKYLNEPISYSKIATELAAAQKEWYSDATGRAQFKAAFEEHLRGAWNVR